MGKNYTVLFVLLFSASIMGGLALKDFIDYSMVIGYGLGILFLISSIFVAIKNKTEGKTM